MLFLQMVLWYLVTFATTGTVILLVLAYRATKTKDRTPVMGMVVTAMTAGMVVTLATDLGMEMVIRAVVEMILALVTTVIPTIPEVATPVGTMA